VLQPFIVGKLMLNFLLLLGFGLALILVILGVFKGWVPIIVAGIFMWIVIGFEYLVKTIQRNYDE